MECWLVILQLLAIAVPITVTFVQYHLNNKKDKKLHYWEEEIVKEQGRLQRGVEFYKIAVATIDDVATIISYLGYVFNRAIDSSLSEVGDVRREFVRMRDAMLELSRCRGRLAATVSDEALMLYEEYFVFFSSLVERLSMSEWIENKELLELENLESKVIRALRDEKMRFQEELSVKSRETQ